MDTATQEALALERKIQIYETKIAKAEGVVAGTLAAYDTLSALSTTTNADLVTYRAELAALKLGAGEGLADDFGEYSAMDQLLRVERFAGKEASIDYIQANPTCEEAAAEAAWEKAGITATGLAALMVPVANYSAIYRAQLLEAGLIKEATYAAQRAWILATDKDVIMGI